jgi:hypothetical protein
MTFSAKSKASSTHRVVSVGGKLWRVNPSISERDAAIVAALRAGASQTSVAREHNVCHQRISQIAIAAGLSRRMKG